jgi:hypothetical protein
MDEYASIAQRVVLTMDDVRGCLVLSRDGLVLGAFPEDEEAVHKPAWLKFTHVGEARRSFVEFADQIWAFIHRGPYAAFVVAGTSVRPGVLLDQLEQALLVAEETRAKRETLKVPDASAAPSGRPRTSLHPPADRPQPVEVSAVPVSDAVPATAEAAPVAKGPWKRPIPGAEPIASTGGGDHVAAEATQAPLTSFRPPTETAEHLELAGDGPAPAFERSPFAEFAGDEPPGDEPADAPMGEDERPEPTHEGAVAPVVAEPDPSNEDAAEIDRVMLAKEFSGLLQLDADDDEARS